MDPDTTALGAPDASPYRPPFFTQDLPGTGGAIGPEPEDFRVDEIPAYAPGGEGEHRYVRIEKRLLTTPEAVKIVADAAGVDARDVGYAGLKDKHAVTTQWVSLPKKSRPVEEWSLPERLKVLEASFHTNKLRTGHLTGNHFSIALTGVEAGALDRAHAICERVRALGLPNYFGSQRFGRDGDNLGRALGFFRGGARQRLNGFLLKLYPSVVQSEVFNRYVTLRYEAGIDRLFAGEIVRLEGSGATFLVEDAEIEGPRHARGEIHVTGPMIGPKMRAASGRPLELELEAARRAGVDEAILSTLGRFAPGARRDVVVHPRALQIASDGAPRLRVDFTLPAGSYATILIREFTRSSSAGDRGSIE
jgi:tRNA pseudouridine13 synthase